MAYFIATGVLKTLTSDTVDIDIRYCRTVRTIDSMITNNEDSIRRVIAVSRNGKAIAPCGACREFMTQLMPQSYRSIEIMMDYENGKVVTLGELTPEWWI